MKIKTISLDLEMARRLKELRQSLFGERGQVAMAKFLGITPTTYNAYEIVKTRIPHRIIAQLAEKKNVNPLWLLMGRGNKFLKMGRPILVKEEKEGYKTACAIPILSDEIAAGPPRTIEEYPAEDFFSFRAHWLPHPKDSFALKVRGDSMEPDIPNGAWVLVDVKDREPRSGMIYAIRAEGGCVVRKFFLNGDILNFFPLKPSPENKFFSFKRPTISPIIGRVIWIFKKL